MTRNKYKHPPRRVWITWDDAYPWEFERPDATEYALVVKTGGFTCVCCGRNMEVRVNGKVCNECASYITTARKEAREEAFKDAAQRLRDKAEDWRQQSERWQRNAENAGMDIIREQDYADRDACLSKMAAAMTLAIEFNEAAATTQKEGNEKR